MGLKSPGAALAALRDARLAKPLSGVFATLAEDACGGVGLLSGEGTGVTVAYTYSTEARCECVAEGSAIGMLLDFNFVDLTLELVAATEVEDDALRDVCALLTCQRTMLEAALPRADHPFFHGVLLDYLVSATSAATQLGYLAPVERNLPRAEYVTRLIAAHEVTHGRLVFDADFASLQLERLRREVYHARPHAEAVFQESGEAAVHNAVQAAATSLNDYDRTGIVSLALEELLCDQAMIRAAAEVILKTPQRRDALGTFVALTSATMNAVWLLPLLQKGVRAILDAEGPVALSPGPNRDVRSVLGMLTFLRHLGSSLAEGQGVSASRAEVVRHWTETFDYDGYCARLARAIFEENNLVRLLAIGTQALEHGLAEPASARNGAQRLLGWPT